MRFLALYSIRFYKRRISPYKGFCCPYREHLGRFSCSTIGYRAIRRFGLLRGVAVLRQRTRLCAFTQRRHRHSAAERQRGSAAARHVICLAAWVAFLTATCQTLTAEVLQGTSVAVTYAHATGRNARRSLRVNQNGMCRHRGAEPKDNERTTCARAED